MIKGNLPSLPKFKIGDDVDYNFDSNEVYFLLELGVDTVVCKMKGEKIVEPFECHTGGDVENGREIDFKYFKVSDTEVFIDQSDIDIESNQKIELTDSQIYDLNEKLKNEMVVA